MQCYYGKTYMSAIYDDFGLFTMVFVHKRIFIVNNLF
jgi:hypothetical protein